MNQILPLEPLRFAAPLLLCALTACGGSNAPSGPPPTISDFSFTPSDATVGTANTLTGTLFVADADGDEAEIDASITLPGGQSQTLPPTALQGAAGHTGAAIQFTLILTPPAAGSYRVTVSVKDTEGLSSNPLTTTVDAK